MLSGGLADPSCLLVLPLSPHKLFISSNDPRLTRPLPVARHAEKVRQAREFVWGTDDDQLEFVRKHIRTAPDRVILTDAQRRQGIAAARGLLRWPQAAVHYIASAEGV